MRQGKQTAASILSRGYDAVIYGMAVLAGAVIVATFAAIVGDVTLRNLGLPTPAATSALTEYAMLVATMGAAPLLVRERCHVWVGVLESIAGKRCQRLLGFAAIVLCIAVCGVMAWYATTMALDAAARNEVDIRSIILPRWFLYAVLALGFVLCATEFLRFLLRGEDMYDRPVTEQVAP